MVFVELYKSLLVAMTCTDAQVGYMNGVVEKYEARCVTVAGNFLGCALASDCRLSDDGDQGRAARIIVNPHSSLANAPLGPELSSASNLG